MTLNGNASLLLEIHIVEHLPLSNLDSVGLLQKTIGYGTLSVVDMGYDAEITYIVHNRLQNYYYFRTFQRKYRILSFFKGERIMQ